MVLVRIPYAYLGGLFVQAKMKFNDYRISKRWRPHHQTGTEWYNSDAFSTVSQAIGRNIRHDEDWAVIVLVDERYSNKKERLPLWARQNFRASKCLNDFVNILCEFIAQQIH